MPIITLDYEDLERLCGADKEEILQRIPMIGADIERIEPDYVDVEFFPNRPDMFSVEGVSRAMRGFLGIETGFRKYQVKKSNVKLRVEPSVKNVRPCVVCAIVRDVNLDSGTIESLMGLQEDLHWGIGRNRKKISIGVHDLSRVKPPFRYLSEDPGFSFVPLDYTESMTMDEILKEHPKGMKFAYILESKDKYPLILDSNDDVLSFPPIINGELTRVTEDTRDLFIDVTGLDESVNIALNIISTSLAERGGSIESVLILDDANEKKVTPDLNPSIRQISVKEAQKLIGLKISPEECKECLMKMRFGAKLLKGKSKIEVEVPAYRADILHSWDIIEDIAIGYGYDRIEPVFPKTVTIGTTHPVEGQKALIREIMVGLGYFEVMTFTLTNEEKNLKKMRLSASASTSEPADSDDNAITRLKHPISEDYTILRTSILPNLLEILSLNKHREMPHRIFEVSEVIIHSKNKERVAGVSIHSNSDFSEVKSVVESLLREMEHSFEIAESKNPTFLEGRVVDVIANGEVIGVFGEIHPGAITNFELSHPICGFELNVEGYK